MRVTTASAEPHEGKPNYLLQEARNEEALARLDMNLVSGAPVAVELHSGVQRHIKGSGLWGKIGAEMCVTIPSLRTKLSSLLLSQPTFMPKPACQSSKTFLSHLRFHASQETMSNCQPHIIDISCEPDHILHSHRPIFWQLSIVQGCHEKIEKLCTILIIQILCAFH